MERERTERWKLGGSGEVEVGIEGRTESSSEKGAWNKTDEKKRMEGSGA